MRRLVDTSVLLRWSQADVPEHIVCRRGIDHLLERGDDLCMCAQVLIEYWVAATRPRDVNGFGLSPREAEPLLADIDDMFTCLPEPPDIAARWRKIVVDNGVLGKQAHDARLSAAG